MPHSRPSYRPPFGALALAAIVVLLGAAAGVSVAGERTLAQMRDFDLTEVKSAGFSLGQQTRVRIRALGTAAGKDAGVDLYAYGWIIDADSRQLVWKMTRDQSVKAKDDRAFDGEITLPKGNYEVYFTAYAFGLQTFFSSFTMNIDRRDHGGGSNLPQRKRGFLPWLDDFLGGDMEKEWKKRSKNWGIELSVPDNVQAGTFAAPRELPNALYRAVRLGENEHIRQQFTIAKPMQVRVYAIGEIVPGVELADYGWIVDVKSRRRVWEMSRSNSRPAGGDDKNVKFDRVITLPEGEYVLYYITDDSHSTLDWNAAPPDDPLNYGVTLMAANADQRGDFKLASRKAEENVLVSLARVKNDEMRTAAFALKAESQLRIYALGERQLSRRGMADYGWIINAKTRERVWSMESERTEFAGGADKNRVIDEVITLPKGSYVVYFKTDDSHAYNDWNAKEPFDPDHYGITIYGAGDNFVRSNVETNVNAKQEAGVLAQIIHVGNNVNRSERFSIDRQTTVRIFALGEGQGREMFDYGWIEKANTQEIVWEMTYDVTFHGGGARKNRMVNATITLERGIYELHYVSDDSHSFAGWNMDPPDDPTMWGITVSLDQ